MSDVGRIRTETDSVATMPGVIVTSRSKNIEFFYNKIKLPRGILKFDMITYLNKKNANMNDLK